MPPVNCSSSASISHLAKRAAFTAFLTPLRKIRWYVYGKRPFAGPEAVLAYLSRYTHRVAIANSRLIAFDKNTVSFKYKDYRLEGPDRYKTMTLATNEFIRRFLIHVLPKAFSTSTVLTRSTVVTPPRATKSSTLGCERRALNRACGPHRGYGFGAASRFFPEGNRTYARR